MLELFVCVVRTYKLNYSLGNDITAIFMTLCLIYSKIKSRSIHLMKSFLYASDIHEYHGELVASLSDVLACTLSC